MAGESPDWGSVATVQGPPIVNLGLLGPLTALVPLLVADTVDVSGFAGVWVSVTPSLQGNIKVDLTWEEPLSGGGFVVVGQDSISFPKGGNTTQPGQSHGRWFPARAQRLSVDVTCNVTANNSSGMAVLPTTAVYNGKAQSSMVTEAATYGQGPGLLAGIDTAVGAGTSSFVELNGQYWGRAVASSGVSAPAGSYVQVLGFDFEDTQVHNAIVQLAGLPTGPVEFLLPALCYHKLGFHNGGGVGFNPVLTLVGDMI